MVKLLEFLDMHTARHLFRSSHLKITITIKCYCLSHGVVTCVVNRVVSTG